MAAEGKYFESIQGHQSSQDSTSKDTLKKDARSSSESGIKDGINVFEEREQHFEED